MRKTAELFCALAMMTGMIMPVRAEESAYEKALRAAAEAQEKVNSITAQLAEGSAGFFRWHGDTMAVDIINNGIEKGRNLGLSTGLTRTGRAGDATSLDNLKAAVGYLKEGNQLRADEGAEALMVTDRMMALAEVNTNYAAENYIHWYENLSVYTAGENYSYWYTDPYDYWYTLEKEHKENGTGDFAHFDNLINTNYLVTGFGVNTVTNTTHYCQDFGSQWCMQRLSGTYGKTYTVAQYEKDVNTYISTMNSDLAAAKKVLEETLKQLEPYEKGGYKLGSAPKTAKVGDILNMNVLVSGTQTTTAVWSASSTVASVDQNGKVTCRRTGTVTITAKSPTGRSDSVSLRVLFTDVPASGVYYSDPVYWAVDKGITYGFTDNDGFARTFGPEKNCTRAQMVTFLWRLAGKPNPRSAVCSFSDMDDPSAYYYKAVIWADEAGITGGYSDGTFHPDATCLREHAVTFLYRYAGKPEIKASANPFNDIAEDAYYYRPSVWANENGIANGYSSGEHAGGFGPQLDCLREHIVTFMYRYAN